MRSYGQYCPIARTSELVAERWTPIIIRNLLAGCETFGELLAGAPGISKALLTQRLELLEHHGVVERRVAAERRRVTYHLTEKGFALKAVTDAMGAWGAKWLEVEPEHVDAAYVLWATCRLVDVAQIPDDGLVVRIELRDRPADRFWLVLRPSHAELCSTYLGWDEDAVVRTDSDTLAHWHLRHLTYDDAVAAGLLEVTGPPKATRAFLRSLRPSPFAGFQPEPGIGRRTAVRSTSHAAGAVRTVR